MDNEESKASLSGIGLEDIESGKFEGIRKLLCSLIIHMNTFWLPRNYLSIYFLRNPQIRESIQMSDPKLYGQPPCMVLGVVTDMGENYKSHFNSIVILVLMLPKL